MPSEVSPRPAATRRAPWVMAQSWRDLLFAHWPVSPEAMRRLVPEPLEVETHDGSAWVGLTPFVLEGLRVRGTPSRLGLSFPELNLRTYVRHGDVSGIFFFTLEASSALAVMGARLGYALPYRPAQMHVERRAGWIHYASRRRGPGRAEVRVRYRPAGDPFFARTGSLEHFLTERYALFTVGARQVLRGDIAHAPWPLQPAEAVLERNTLPGAHGIVLPDTPPLLHYAGRLDVRVWPPIRVGRAP